MASELESDLRDTLEWREKWFVEFNAEKTQLVLFSSGAIDVKIDGCILEKK